MSEINKAINREIEKEKVIQESFDSLWDDFNLMIRLRKIALNHLKKARLKLSLDVFLIDQNPKIMVRLQELSEEISTAIEEINSEQELLNIIKRNIMRLEVFKITDFNNEIDDLIVLIKKKNDSICDTALINLKLSLLVLGGCKIDEDEFKEEVDVNTINNKIEEKSLSLGLKDIENK